MVLKYLLRDILGCYKMNIMPNVCFFSSNCGCAVNPHDGRRLRRDGRGRCAHEVQGIMQGVTDRGCYKASCLYLSTKGERMVFVLHKQPPSVEWINWGSVSP